MRLLLVDGHYYAYRSFFAIRDLTNSRGEPTNAVFGFVKALRKMLSDLQPDAAAVIWDAGLPERRMVLLPTYKQQRDETPGDLEVQFPIIEEAAAALGVRNASLAGHEADDLIASYAAAARKQSADVIIATNDKDIYALVGEGVAVYSTNKTDLKDPTDSFALLGPTEVEEKWGVPPAKIPDVLALTGDAVDNIPGVDGVGPKRQPSSCVSMDRPRSSRRVPRQSKTKNSARRSPPRLRACATISCWCAWTPTFLCR